MQVFVVYLIYSMNHTLVESILWIMQVFVVYFIYSMNHMQASLTVTDNMGRQSLHLAAQAGSLKTMAYLLDQPEVNVNKPTSKSGVTPLHLACKASYYSMGSESE